MSVRIICRSFPKRSCRFLSLVKIKPAHGSVPLNAVATRAMPRDQDSRDTSKETNRDLLSHVFTAVVSCALNLLSTNLAMRGFEAPTCFGHELQPYSENYILEYTHSLLQNVSAISYELRTCGVHQHTINSC